MEREPTPIPMSICKLWLIWYNNLRVALIRIELGTVGPTSDETTSQDGTVARRCDSRGLYNNSNAEDGDVD